MEEESLQEHKKSNKGIWVLISIALIIIIIVSVIIIRNNKDDKRYLETYHIGTTHYSNFGIKTLIVQIIDDKGDKLDIFKDDDDYYYFLNHSYPLLRFYGYKTKFLNSSDVLKLYYEYDIKTTGGKVYQDSALLELPIEIMENKQIYFPTLTNEIVNERNVGVLSFVPQLNFLLRLTLSAI